MCERRRDSRQQLRHRVLDETVAHRRDATARNRDMTAGAAAACFRRYLMSCGLIARGWVMSCGLLLPERSWGLVGLM
jgi:hypothetical protein